MADPVACAECGVRYDPATSTFCPRCGSTSRGASLPPALEAAQRADPGRRRIQASGAVLAVVGTLLVFLFIPILVLGTSLTSTMLDDLGSQESGFPLAGGTLVIAVTNNNTTASNLPVYLSTPTGVSIANGTTDEMGRFNSTLGDHALVIATLVTPEGNWTRKAVALEGTSSFVRLDLAVDSPTTDSWVGLAPLVRVVRILVAIFLLIAVLLVGAGVSALRLRNWGFAFSSSLLGLLPAVLLVAASLSAGSLLILAVLGFPALIIGRGRRYFASSKNGLG